MGSVDSRLSLRLVNGSTGDPALYVNPPARDDAILFDAGELCALDTAALGDLGAVFISHHHVDHFIGFDRIVRANLDRDKALCVYGPEGTIGKIYDRIKSYEYPFFPFQKIVIEVHEILPGLNRWALLECTQRFPEPTMREEAWSGPIIHDVGDLHVEAIHVDHTTPCLAFALVQTATRAGDPRTPETRIAYVTDTAWSDSVRPALLRLARGATRLYCDSFYAHEHLDRALKHRHMTATQAAELARDACVEELVLIHFASRYQGRYHELVEEARAIFPRVSAEIPTAAAKKPSTRTNGS